MEIGRPFIRLPWTFDAARLQAETAALADAAWQAHPSAMPGNTAVPLIARNGGDNDDFDGRMAPTPHLDACPYVRQVMASFDEVLGRSRLMRLAPGAEVATHVDFNYHWYSRVRIHVPVVTDPAVIFHCGTERLHMRAGECWIFNSWQRHRVVNGGPRDRIHLVIDAAGSSRFWRTVREMAAIAHDGDAEALERRLRHVPFDAGAKPAIDTERYNTAPVMAPGEVDALVRELLQDVGANAANDRGLLARYTEMLLDFSKDWRATWLRYGYSRDGWPHYERVAAALTDGLHPDPRALVTASNGIGINPVIMQRIVRAALATEHHERFVRD